MEDWKKLHEWAKRYSILLIIWLGFGKTNNMFVDKIAGSCNGDKPKRRPSRATQPYNSEHHGVDASLVQRFYIIFFVSKSPRRIFKLYASGSNSSGWKLHHALSAAAGQFFTSRFVWSNMAQLCPVRPTQKQHTAKPVSRNSCFKSKL